MIIKSVITGKYGKSKRYYIRNDSGDNIVCFDSLYEAGVVFRYLIGAPLDEMDYAAARNAIQMIDKGEQDE